MNTFIPGHTLITLYKETCAKYAKCIMVVSKFYFAIKTKDPNGHKKIK